MKKWIISLAWKIIIDLLITYAESMRNLPDPEGPNVPSNNQAFKDRWNIILGFLITMRDGGLPTPKPK